MGHLKVIVMSATLAAEEFSQYFNQAKVLYIQGRQFPVQVSWQLLVEGSISHCMFRYSTLLSHSLTTSMLLLCQCCSYTRI